MPTLTFKIHKAGENKRPACRRGRSPIEIILKDKKRIFKATAENTDNLLSALDTLLKKSKIELESLKEIKLENSKQAGLTSQRIVKTIVKALCLKL